MMKKKSSKSKSGSGKNHYAFITIGVIGGLYLIMTLICIFKAPGDFSLSERRPLATMPDITAETWGKGTFQSGFETYVTDQFPFRDTFRAVKGNFEHYLMLKNDVNGIVIKDGYLYDPEYPADAASIDYATAIFGKMYENRIKESEAKIYVAVVPDKGAFIEGAGLKFDYDEFSEQVYDGMPYATPIQIYDLLEQEDYYKTDSHWRQERIGDVAERIAEGMNVSFSGGYETVTLETPFYGVYYGQAALQTEPDRIAYCRNEILDSCKVFDLENNKEIPLYDTSKAEGRDPYEMFLGGNISLALIENPAADPTRELVVFGDSFSRSLVPLLAEGYGKVTLVDIRYLPSAYVGNYVTFTNQDVLFLYSTSVLNNSITLK